MSKRTNRPSKPRKFIIHDGTNVRDCAPELAGPLQVIAEELKQPVLVLLQRAPGRGGSIDRMLWIRIMHLVRQVGSNRGITLVIDSPGGQADAAYKIAQLLRNTYGDFTAVIPAYAKSAATLMLLGAKTRYLGSNAELGPLDVQVGDPDREDFGSALEVTQAFERLSSEALSAVDAQMSILQSRSGKRIERLLPIAMHFIADLMKPMVDKIDTREFGRMARLLRVAEDYGARLLAHYHSPKEAEGIARQLTQAYSDHGFVVDVEELDKIGLPYNDEERSAAFGKALEDLALLFEMFDGNLVGLFTGVPDEETKQELEVPAKRKSAEREKSAGNPHRKGNSRRKDGPSSVMGGDQHPDPTVAEIPPPAAVKR